MAEPIRERHLAHMTPAQALVVLGRRLEEAGPQLVPQQALELLPMVALALPVLQDMLIQMANLLGLAGMTVDRMIGIREAPPDPPGTRTEGRGPGS